MNEKTKEEAPRQSETEKADEPKAPRRFAWIAVLALCTVLAVVAAFFLGKFVRSPNEEAIANSQHAPQVTATVEKRSLNIANKETKGKVSVGRTWNVNVEAGEGRLAVVTKVHASAGQSVTSGTVLANVSGRPVIALALPFDLYRDIRGGDSGDDVAALQRALKAMGLYSAGIDGVYGAQTSAAVERFYKRVGASAPTVGTEATEALKEAEKAVKEAQKALVEAPEDTSAKQSLSEAQTQLSQAKLKGVTPVLRSEITTIPQGSVSLVSIAEVNTHLSNDNPLATLRSGDATVKARVPVADKEVFAVGTQVTVTSASDSSITSAASVVSMGEFQQTSGDERDSVPGYDITIALSAPASFSDGQTVTVSTSGEKTQKEGTVVPLTAIREDGSGTYVTRKNGEKVKVSILMTADGFAMLDEGDLKIGEEVLVSHGS